LLARQKMHQNAVFGGHFLIGNLRACFYLVQVNIMRLMGQRKCLNEKRLTKKQVQELVEKEGQLHNEYTAFFQETYASGHVKRDLVYELPDDRFLYVFDQQDISTPGKGDIYAKAYFLKWMVGTPSKR
jgi:hypothetical protein